MPIHYREEQTKISLQGDIAVLPFYPEDCNGIAWLLFEQGSMGEPGRPVVDLSPRLLSEQKGVLIGAQDPRSLDVIIDYLTVLRDKLVEQQFDKEMKDCGLPHFNVNAPMPPVEQAKQAPAKRYRPMSLYLRPDFKIKQWAPPPGVTCVECGKEARTAQFIKGKEVYLCSECILKKWTHNTRKGDNDE